MRKIIFRGKDKKTGEWFFGNLYDKDIHGRTHIATTKKGCLNIDADTVGQFTGVYDDTDEESPIYEGDILELVKIYDDASSAKVYAEVKWLEGYGGFILDVLNKNRWMSFAIAINELLVYKIGNIYDNPELLKGGIE